MNNSSRDAGIPILTEVINLNEEEAPLEIQAPPPELQPEAPRSDEALEEQAKARFSDEEWRRLERRIRERILQQLLARIDSSLEQRVRDSLADVLQTAVESLAADIQSGLHEGLENMIARAVAQEISRLQSSKE